MIPFVSAFLSLKTILPKLIAVVGPTGSGKTAFSLRLAKEIGGSIINADSKQVYKGLEVCTGSISPAEQEGIEHFLFSCLDVKAPFNVSIHCQMAEGSLQNTISQGKIPILVGGTGLFINALCQNFAFQGEANEFFRKEYEQKTTEELFEALKKIDPESTIDSNNKRRIIRALEIFHESHLMPSQKTTGEKKYESLILMPHINSRETLYENINTRASFIWHHGLIKEAEHIQAQHLEENAPALQCIGLKEAIDYLSGKLSEAEGIQIMQQKSRNYAKRQLTWWRRYKQTHAKSVSCIIL